MSKGFFYKRSDKQTVNNVDQVIGRLALPSGNYIIIGEASVAATKLSGIIDFDQPLVCTLKAGAIEDKVMLNLWRDGFQGGNWGVIALTIRVKFDGGITELTCSPGNPGCILVFDVALSAIQVDELQASEDPSTHHKSYWYNKIQERSIMRFSH
jgi:hypothetical protein